MFTGIVEAVGKLVEVKPMAGGYRVRIETALAAELKPGDSLAVNGVCLTVILTDGGEVHADVGPETARVTTLGGLQRGPEREPRAADAARRPARRSPRPGPRRRRRRRSTSCGRRPSVTG